MAINLGNIRSAGFRKGLATGFIKSEAAKADADRREKEYQQLLAREQANREFQASQSSLSRASSVEQARLNREAQAKRDTTKASQFEKTFLQTQQQIDAKETERKETITRNRLDIMVNIASKTGVLLDYDKVAQDNPDMKALPNFKLKIKSANTLAGQFNKDEAKKVADVWTKSFLDKKLRVQDAQMSYDILSKVDAPVLKEGGKIISFEQWKSKLKNKWSN